jgi:gamma-glutamylcyclotransferase (GGCT)/AIG2-like uncharacterized protein YtfP
MDHGPTYLFAYGLLMSGFEGHRWVSPWVEAYRPAHCTGRLLRLTAGYPALVDDDRGTVHGQLLRLKPGIDWVRLDAYEDVVPDDPDRSQYRRVQRPCLSDGVTVIAWCYVVPADRAARLEAGGARWIPGGRFTR